jgi:hypothetical protein
VNIECETISSRHHSEETVAARTANNAVKERKRKDERKADVAIHGISSADSSVNA